MFSQQNAQEEGGAMIWTSAAPHHPGSSSGVQAQQPVSLAQAYMMPQPNPVAMVPPYVAAQPPLYPHPIFSPRARELDGDREYEWQNQSAKGGTGGSWWKARSLLYMLALVLIIITMLVCSIFYWFVFRDNDKIGTNAPTVTPTEAPTFSLTRSPTVLPVEPPTPTGCSGWLSGCVWADADTCPDSRGLWLIKGHRGCTLCCPPSAVCATLDDAGAGLEAELQREWCQVMGNELSGVLSAPSPPFSTYFVPFPINSGGDHDKWRATLATTVLPSLHGVGNRCEADQRIWYYKPSHGDWISGTHGSIDRQLGHPCGTNTTSTTFSSECILSEHYSCVRPHDERFPCTVGAINTGKGEVYQYGYAGECKLVACASGYFVNTWDVCEAQPDIPADDGKPVEILDSAGVRLYTVHIHAMYKDRFTKGMTVIVQPPDGVAAFDPVEVGGVSDVLYLKSPPSVQLTLYGGLKQSRSFANAEPSFNQSHSFYGYGAGVIVRPMTEDDPYAAPHACITADPSPCAELGADAHCNPTSPTTHSCAVRAANLSVPPCDNPHVEASPCQACSRKEQCMYSDQPMSGYNHQIYCGVPYMGDYKVCTCGGHDSYFDYTVRLCLTYPDGDGKRAK